jgi:hypothetical protein
MRFLIIDNFIDRKQAKRKVIDNVVVLQKIVVNSGGLKPGYLGTYESFFKLADFKK